MDDQFLNTAGSSPDNQIPDIFEEQPGTEQPVTEPLQSEGIAGKESFGEENVVKEEAKTYTDPNSGYGENTNGYTNADPNLNQGSTAYGNGQYQSYTGNVNTGYQQGYGGNQNTGYQPNYGGNPNTGYQSNYSGNVNNGYQPNYGGNANNSYQSNYIGVPNTGYQQNYGNNPNSPYNGMDTSPLSMGDWLLTLLACMIPCAGTILSLVWAFGKHGNVNRRNFCRAQLIITAVVLVLYIIVFLIWGVSLAGALSTY